MEYEILGFGIRNTTQGIRNPLTIQIWNPSPTDKESESSNWNRESMARNPESKIFLDSLAWGEAFRLLFFSAIMA